jgi:hypothetical protein
MTLNEAKTRHFSLIAGTFVVFSISFPGSAWKSTAPEALPPFRLVCKNRNLRGDRAEPAIHRVPRQSLGTSTCNQRQVSFPVTAFILHSIAILFET